MKAVSFNLSETCFLGDRSRIRGDTSDPKQVGTGTDAGSEHGAAY